MTLLGGLQSLAFAGAGALLGTAVQGQVTSNVKGDLGKADTAKGVLRDKIVEYKDAAQKGHLQRQTDGGALKDVLEIALAENPTTYATDDARKVRVDQLNELAFGSREDVVRDLDRTLEQADRIRNG